MMYRSPLAHPMVQIYNVENMTANLGVNIVQLGLATVHAAWQCQGADAGNGHTQHEYEHGVGRWISEYINYIHTRRNGKLSTHFRSLPAVETAVTASEVISSDRIPAIPRANNGCKTRVCLMRALSNIAAYVTMWWLSGCTSSERSTCTNPEYLNTSARTWWITALQNTFITRIIVLQKATFGLPHSCFKRSSLGSVVCLCQYIHVSVNRIGWHRDCAWFARHGSEADDINQAICWLSSAVAFTAQASTADVLLSVLVYEVTSEAKRLT